MTVRATTAVRAPACRRKDEIASEIDSGRRRWTRNAKADRTTVREEVIIIIERSVPEVIVEVPELALRFRETPRTIKDALLLPRGMSRAEPIHLGGCWKLQLAGTLPCGRDGVHSATRHSHSVDDDKDDLGAA